LGVLGRVRRLQFDLGRRFLPPADVTRQTKNGLLTFSNKDGMVGRHLYANDQWSWDLLQDVTALLLREDLIGDTGNDLLINVGANIGSILIPVMRSGRFRRGLAFEPAPANAAYLRLNVEQNGLSDVVDTFELGLSDRVGVAEFEMSPSNMGDHRVRMNDSRPNRPAEFQESDRTVVEVDLARLDDVLRERGFDPGARPLYWVDVQGHEGHFLRGARQTLVRGAPMVLEVWPYGLDRSGFGASEFCELIRELFVRFYFKEGNGWQQSSTDEFRSLYDRHGQGTSGADVVLVVR